MGSRGVVYQFLYTVSICTRNTGQITAQKWRLQIGLARKFTVSKKVHLPENLRSLTKVYLGKPKDVVLKVYLGTQRRYSDEMEIILRNMN